MFRCILLMVNMVDMCYNFPLSLICSGSLLTTLPLTCCVHAEMQIKSYVLSKKKTRQTLHILCWIFTQYIKTQSCMHVYWVLLFTLCCLVFALTSASVTCLQFLLLWEHVYVLALAVTLTGCFSVALWACSCSSAHTGRPTFLGHYALACECTQCNNSLFRLDNIAVSPKHCVYDGISLHSALMWLRSRWPL